MKEWQNDTKHSESKIWGTSNQSAFYFAHFSPSLKTSQPKSGAADCPPLLPQTLQVMHLALLPLGEVLIGKIASDGGAVSGTLCVLAVIGLKLVVGGQGWAPWGTLARAPDRFFPGQDQGGVPGPILRSEVERPRPGLTAPMANRMLRQSDTSVQKNISSDRHVDNGEWPSSWEVQVKAKLTALRNRAGLATSRGLEDLRVEPNADNGIITREDGYYRASSTVVSHSLDIDLIPWWMSCLRPWGRACQNAQETRKNEQTSSQSIHLKIGALITVCRGLTLR